MKKQLSLIILFVFGFGILNAQKAEDKIKMFNAQQKFFAGDYKAALNIYKDVLSANPNSADVMFHIAEVKFAMKDYNGAQTMANKAKSIDPKANEGLPLLSGKINHHFEKFDEALMDFNAYKEIVGTGRKYKESEVAVDIAQVKVAKELKANPVKLKVLNMGESINSKQDDKSPAVSADGKVMVFTSRRPGKSSELDTEGDGGYFEDIYISRWDTVRGMWAEPELIPGKVNTTGHDACTSISPDGKKIFLYKNDIDEASRGGDIYITRVSSSGRWGSPKPMGTPINSTYWEGGACISPDGRTIYLISERKGGLGRGDIYVSKKKGPKWSTPVNIGSHINTEQDEGGLFLAPDGKTLFFSSNGPGSMGGYDVFKTVNVKGKWTKPVNLGHPINTVYNDMCLTVTVDANTGYFTSDRVGGFGERDLYSVDLTKYRVLEEEMVVKEKSENTGPVMGILKGTVFDASEGSAMEADIVISNEAGEEVGKTTSSSGNGEYFITLETNKTYTITIDKKGFKPISEKVEYKAASKGATTVVKHFLLYKKD